jgi:protein ImuA
MVQASVIASLRARIADVEGKGIRYASLPFGVDMVDRHLPSGGIQCGVLHEVAGGPELADDASATIFLAGILARLEGPVFWCLRWRDLFAPALHLCGLHPDRVVHVEAGSALPRAGRSAGTHRHCPEAHIRLEVGPVAGRLGQETIF